MTWNKQDKGVFLDFFAPFFTLTLVRLGSLHNKSLFVMTVNHEQIQLSLDPLFLLSLPSSLVLTESDEYSTRLVISNPILRRFESQPAVFFCVSQFWGTAA